MFAPDSCYFEINFFSRILLQDHLKACLARTEERINWLLDLEDKAFSLNTHYLSDYKSKFLAYYRSARRKNNHNVIMDSINAYAPPANPTPAVSSKQAPNPVYGVSKVLSGLTEMGFNGVQANDLAKLLRTDNMEPAIEIMADVRAYFQGISLCDFAFSVTFDQMFTVAYKRFSDNIPMAIDRELVCGAGRDILPLLRNGLGLNSLEAHRICKELAQENTSVANRREELLKKLQRLDEASQQLLQVSGA